MTTRAKKKSKPLINVIELPSRPQRPTVQQIHDDLTDVQVNDVILTSLPRNWQGKRDLSTLDIDEEFEGQKPKEFETDSYSLYEKAVEMMRLRTQVLSAIKMTNNTADNINENKMQLNAMVAAIKAGQSISQT